MTLERFITTTQAVIAEDGLDGYLPTVMVEGWWTVKYHVMTDVPPGVDVESFARDWAVHVAGRKKDYALAFRLDAGHFKVVSRQGGLEAERVVAVPAA